MEELSEEEEIEETPADPSRFSVPEKASAPTPTPPPAPVHEEVENKKKFVKKYN